MFVTLPPEKVTFTFLKVTFSREKVTFTILKVTFSALKVTLLHINIRINMHCLPFLEKLVYLIFWYCAGVVPVYCTNTWWKYWRLLKPQ